MSTQRAGGLDFLRGSRRARIRLRLEIGGNDVQGKVSTCGEEDFGGGEELEGGDGAFVGVGDVFGFRQS